MKKLLRLLDHDLSMPLLGAAALLGFCGMLLLADACESAAKRSHELELKRLERAAPAASGGAP